MNELVNNKQKWEMLYDVIVGMDYEDIIPHNEISELIQEPENTPMYYSIIKRANKSLLEIGKAIKVIKGQGYRVLKPSEYTQESISKFRQGARCIKNGENLLTYAPTKHMNGEELKAHRNVSDRARILHASIQGACVELNLLNKKNHPMLPENVNK